MAEGAKTSSAAAWYVLIIVTLANVACFIDRQIVAILLPGIKEEFHLSDAALGFWAGPAFAVPYSVLAILLAVASDRGNRRNLIAASIAVFSIMTTLTGFVGQFWQLLLTRFTVGGAQAGLSPPITSLLADLFPREKRASAIALYSAGANIGMLVVFLIGGWMLAHYSWRTALIWAGLPGIALALLMFLTVQEPVRGGMEEKKGTQKAPSLLEAIRILASSKTYVYVVLGTAIRTTTGYGVTYFYLTFTVRSHHLSVEMAAYVSAFLFGFCGGLGTYLGGPVADHFTKKDIRAQLYVPVAIMLICAPLVPFMLLVKDFWLAMIVAIIPMMLNAAYVGPVYSAMQLVTPLRVRALSAGVFLFVITIIGLSIGPWLAGWMSDLLRPWAGQDSMRYALLMHCPGMLLAALFFWLGSRTLIADMEKVK